MKQIWLVGVLLTACLTGCTRGNENNSGNQQPSTMQEGTSTSQLFTKGIVVDFTKLNEDFITNDIRQKLKDNLEALVNKDEDKFKAGLLEGHDTPGNMAYVKDTNQYQILDITESRYNSQAHSIMISLSAKVLRGKNIDESTITYYFETDKTGEWKIALID